MKVFCACSGMMLAEYDFLRDRILKPERNFSELRSYVELEWFTGHTLPRFGKTFFLDSGAFSAHSVGREVDIDKYADFLHRYGSQMDYYANLDAIPKTSAEQAAKDTLAHQTILESYGLKPIPVFHKGEPWSFLEQYIERYPYLCLGGLVSDSDISNEQFFDYVWSRYLTKPDGSPKVKVHAFGMTSLELMLKYPWYSVDSSTWLIHAKLGQVVIPAKKNGKYDYTRKPYILAVSEKASARQWLGWHIDTLNDDLKGPVLEYLTERGMEVEDLRGYPSWRFLCNLEYWVDVQAYAPFVDKYLPREVDLL